MEEEITKAKNCRETIISIYRSPVTFLYDRFRSLESGGTDSILWKLTSLRLVFDDAKSAARLDNAATNPSTHYNSPVYRTHPHGYMAITALFSSTHMVWTLPQKTRFNYVHLIPQRLRWFIGMNVP